MSIEKRKSASGTRWRAKIFHHGRLVTSGTFDRKSEAQAFEREWRRDLARGGHLSAGLRSVRKWASVWERSLRDVAPTTKRDYSQLLHRWVLPRWGDVAARDVTVSQVRAWAAEIRSARSASTARKAVGVLAQVLQVAVEDRALESNPARGIGVASTARNEPVGLTHAQVWAIAERVESQWRLPVLVGAYCGLRLQELAGLNVADFDAGRSQLSVTRAYRLDGPSGTKRVLGPTKTRQARVLSVPGRVSAELEEVVRGRRADEPLLLFPQYADGRMRSDRLRDVLIAASEALEGCPRVTPHNLRDTYASLAIQAGATVSEVSRALGHANALTTLRHYVTWFPSGLEAVASRLDAGISEVSGGQGSISPAPKMPQGGAAGWYPGDCNQLKIEDDQRE